MCRWCRGRRRTGSCRRCWRGWRRARRGLPGWTIARPEETFDDGSSRCWQNPYRGYITIVEGCDKFCAYCVVPYTRGKERSRGSSSVLAEARRIADLGYSEIQLLGQNVNSYRDPDGKLSFADSAGCGGAGCGNSPGCGLRRAIRGETLPRTLLRRSTRCRLCRDHAHLASAVGFVAGAEEDGAGVYAEWYLERIAWIKSAKRQISISTDIIVGLPGETAEDFIETMDLLQEVQYDCVFGFKYSGRPNTPWR